MSKSIREQTKENIEFCVELIQPSFLLHRFLVLKLFVSGFLLGVQVYSSTVKCHLVHGLACWACS
jgi:hypothetical protein